MKEKSDPDLTSARFISEKAVRESLDSLLYTSTDKGQSQLEKLMLIDEFLSNPDLPNTPHKREFAVHHILTSIIVDELVSHRKVYDFNAPQHKTTIKTAKDEITQDTQTNNQELIGWSWLYYHYVRVDLNITPSEFSQLALVDRRTLRRYQLHTIKRLTQRLFELEWDSSKRQRERRLYAELPLPMMTRMTLFGRDHDLRRMRHMMQTLTPCHIQITGNHGIGKTAFVQEIVREEIDKGHADHLIWINEPQSVNDVYQMIEQQLNYTAINQTLRQYLTTKQVIIVLDDIHNLNTSDDFLSLLDDLSNAVVLLINHHYLFLKNAKGHLQLNKLDDAAVADMIRDMVAKNYHGELASITADDIAVIQQTTQGHPLAIMEAIHALYSIQEAS